MDYFQNLPRIMDYSAPLTGPHHSQSCAKFNSLKITQCYKITWQGRKTIFITLLTCIFSSHQSDFDISNDMFQFLQIIFRARRNHLLEKYIEENNSAEKIIDDVNTALEVM